jgi:hypothetical protein
MGFYFHLVSAFFWVFSLTIFLRDSIFILFLFSQLRDSFLNRLACMISGNSTLIFFLLDHCQKIKLCKKVHKTKERKEIIWLEKKKTKGRSKDIYYWNVKPLKHYYLNKRKPITNSLHRSSPFIKCLMFLYSVSSINNQTWFPIVVLTRPTSKRAHKSLLLV